MGGTFSPPSGFSAPASMRQKVLFNLVLVKVLKVQIPG